MDRRAFLATTALATALPALPARAKAVDTYNGGDLPMPAPRDGLDPRPTPEEPGRLLLDRGWRFHLGDVPMPEIKGHQATYENAKAGAAHGAAAMTFDDSDWR